MGWRDISANPNSEEVLAARRSVLDAARSDGTLERLDVIRELCSGKRVVDVGCVDHFVETSSNPTWLHRQIVELATECIGVDIESDGVDAMRRAGFDVVLHDITDGPGLLAERGTFDVVVAGELIEHLGAPRALFDFARDVLKPGGHLVISTPNPFAWRRTRAGQRAITWENADHVTYIPPTGVVELAERAGGLRLVRYGASARANIDRPVRSAFGVAMRLVTRGPGYGHRDPNAVTPPEILAAISRGPSMRGESLTYVLRREAP